MADIATIQEIADRGLQDQLPPEKRALFDELVNRGAITLSQPAQPQIQQPAQNLAQPVQQAQPEQASFPGSGIIEPIATIASGAIAEPIAGILGTISGLIQGGNIDEAVKTINDVRESMTFQSRTQAGQENIQSIGSSISGGLEAVNQFGRDIGVPESLLKPIGDVAFDVTGSPAVSAAVATIPTAIAEFVGIKGLQGLRSGTRLIDDSGRPTKALSKSLDHQGLIFDNLTP